MYFLYADESGDVGTRNSPTNYFCLSGLVLHELRWHEVLSDIIDFRRSLKHKYGLKLREEIHASHLIHNPGELSRIEKSMRLRLLRDTIDFQANLTDISVINVFVNKSNQPKENDIFEIAWTMLIQRFHNTISHKNFPGPQNPDDKGILFVDQTDELKLRSLLRKMRKYNPIPSMYGTGSLAKPVTTIVEDAVHRNSQHSYFIQLADVNAYFLAQKFFPCKYLKKKGGVNYFSRLGQALCTVASKGDPEGIVRR